MGKKNSFLDDKMQIFNIAFLIFIIIITFGWFFKQKEILEDNIKIESEIERIKEKIAELRKLKEKLRKRKKRMLLYVRLLIGSVFIISDVLYLNYTDPFDNINETLGHLLNINGVILMVYSFIAFITYGTIKNFISTLRLKFIYILEKKHIPSIDELYFLEVELKKLESKLQENSDKLNTMESDFEESVSSLSTISFDENI